MKLNNRGFAITAVLYGLLILFVLLIGSYLLVLSAKKNRIDTITSDLEQEYLINKNLDNFSFPFTIPTDGIYIFSLTDNKGNVYSECILRDMLKNNDVILFDNGLKKGNVYLDFVDQNCDSINRHAGDKYVVTVNKITYIDN